MFLHGRKLEQCFILILVTGIKTIILISSPHLTSSHWLVRDSSNNTNISDTAENHFVWRNTGSEILIVDGRSLDHVEVHKRRQGQSSGIKHFDVLKRNVKKKLSRISSNSNYWFIYAGFPFSQNTRDLYIYNISHFWI